MKSQTIEKLAEVLFEARLELAVEKGEPAPYYQFGSDAFSGLSEGKKDIWRDRARWAIELLP